MKILALLTHTPKADLENAHMVDVWRLLWPLQEVAKNTGWQVDFRSDIFEDAGSKEKQLEKVGEYDLVISSYNLAPMAYVLLRVAGHHYGTRTIIDVDDDLINIGEFNPVKIRFLQEPLRLDQIVAMVEDTEHLAVTTKGLKTVYDARRTPKEGGGAVVLPNRIKRAFYHRPRASSGKSTLRIGYMGSATHYGDIENTGFAAVVREILNRYPKLEFEIVGMPYNFKHRRATFRQGKKGLMGWHEIYHGLNFDIACAPLEDTVFNQGKSPIKYFEYSMMQVPTLASPVGPYKGLKNIVHARNHDEWVEQLSRLIEDEAVRRSVGECAYEEVLKEYTIENTWPLWATYLEKVLSERQDGVDLKVTTEN